ncbi:MAG: helix-turn-helix domain-containing protein [Pseudonocardiaceae bacterium]
MAPQETARPSAEPITAIIADRVRDLREQAGMSQADLAEAMDEKCGIPWKRATVVNLEKRGSRTRGDTAGRDAVTVQELIALSYVLGAPLVSLLADPRTVAMFPVTRGADLDQYVALGWITGQTHLADTPRTAEWATVGRIVRSVIQMWGALKALHQRDEVDVLGNAEYLVEAAEREASRHRSALTLLGQAITAIEKDGAPAPKVPDSVYSRARELGVQLPSPGED